jgi:CRISPR/Cas system-associated exonuclease Cas4 (RecB family)
MGIPGNFTFSQQSLQDFVDCRRRFQYRYLQKLSWPAPESLPLRDFERHLELGARFHRLVQQYFLGISEERLVAALGEPEIQRWWRNFRDQNPAEISGRRLVEMVLSADLPAMENPSLPGESIHPRLVAKYDLLIVDPGKQAVILDWKTSLRRPSRKWLQNRLQTKVYPYVLVTAGKHLNQGKPILPEQVEMIYWFANFPDQTERFAYDTARFETDQQYLLALVTEIFQLSEGAFPVTQDERRCRFCAYRSLCEREVEVGSFRELAEWQAREAASSKVGPEQMGEIELFSG